MKETLKIGGMSCQHCVKAVENALRELEGVDLVHVEVGEADVKYDPGQVSRDALIEAIEEEGYLVETA